MNPKPIKTTNANWHTGVTEKRTPKSYSLVYRNGVVVIAERPYEFCKVLKKQHPNAVITPNY